jgi:predicted ester cyclase
MNAEEMKALGHRIAQAWSEGNLQIIDEVYAPNYVNHYTGEDREKLKQAIEAARTVSSDLHITQSDFIVEGNRLVFRWTLRGTHTGAYAGGPATGKRIELRGLHVARIKNGQVVEEWSRGDDLGLLRQLGAMA